MVETVCGQGFDSMIEVGRMKCMAGKIFNPRISGSWVAHRMLKRRAIGMIAYRLLAYDILMKYH
jgi:hypothetical protein